MNNHGERPQAERSCRLKREHFGRVQILTEKSRLIAPLVHGCLPLLTADCFWTSRERRTCGNASTRRPCVLSLGHQRTRAVVPPTFHGFSFGGAKARIATFHIMILQLVVRWFRTTHRKFSLSDPTVCAFAPPEKRLRSVLP